MAGTTLADRALIRLSGEDVRGFLQGLVTQDLALVQPDVPQWAGLLSAQGKALFDFILWADDDDILIDCEREAAVDLARRLTMYRLRRPITIEREPVLCVHWSFGKGAPDPRLHELGGRWLAPESEGRADAAMLEHRLRRGVTEGRVELGDGTHLWLECNAAELNGVSFGKGCYVGQENTARMNWRQKVNRRLFVVETERHPGQAAQAWYPELGLAVARLRVEDRDVDWGRPIIPAWLEEALA